MVSPKNNLLKKIFQGGGVGVSAGIRDAAVYGLGGVGWKIIGFLLIPVYTRYLSPSDYGIAELILVTAGMVAYIASQGMHTAMFRFHGLECKTLEETKVLLSTCLFHRAVSSVLFYGALIFISPLICQLIFNDLTHVHLFKVVFIGGAFEQLFQVSQTVARMLRKPIDFIVLSWVRLSVGLISNLYLIIVLHLGAEALIYSYTFGVAVGSVVGLLWMIWKQMVQLIISWDLLRRMLAYGLPLVPAFILMGFHLGVSKYFINSFWGEAEVGLYSMAFTFASIAGVIYFEPLQMALTPLLFQTVQESTKQVERLHWFVMVGGILVVMAVVLLSLPVIQLMTTDAFYAAASIAPLLAITFLIKGSSVFASLGIRISRKTWYISFSVMVAVIVNILLNLILVPAYGGQGAALSAIAASLSEVVALHWHSQKFLPAKFHYRSLFLPIALAFLVSACSLVWIPDHLILLLCFRLLLFLIFCVGVVSYCITKDPGIAEIWAGLKRQLSIA